MSDIPEVNGKTILLYQNQEASAIESCRKVLEECGIVAIPCTNPNNFRFVVPEIVVSSQVDLIGRLALQALGTDKPLANFAMAIRAALAPSPVPPLKATK